MKRRMVKMLDDRDTKRRRLRLFDESERLTLFGIIMLLICLLILLAAIAFGVYREYMEIRFYLTH